MFRFADIEHLIQDAFFARMPNRVGGTWYTISKWYQGQESNLRETQLVMLPLRPLSYPGICALARTLQLRDLKGSICNRLILLLEELRNIHKHITKQFSHDSPEDG